MVERSILMCVHEVYYFDGELYLRLQINLQFSDRKKNNLNTITIPVERHCSGVGL